MNVLRVLHYFPLYIILLLWLQIRPSLEKHSESISPYVLATTRAWLMEIERILGDTKNSFLQKWLIQYVQNEISQIDILEKVGLINVDFVRKNE